MMSAIVAASTLREAEVSSRTESACGMVEPSFHAASSRSTWFSRRTCAQSGARGSSCVSRFVSSVAAPAKSYAVGPA
jgi:hypothetical protein